jgi:hypothetical protein
VADQVLRAYADAIAVPAAARPVHRAAIAAVSAPPTSSLTSRARKLPSLSRRSGAAAVR